MRAIRVLGMTCLAVIGWAGSAQARQRPPRRADVSVAGAVGGAAVPVNVNANPNASVTPRSAASRPRHVFRSPIVRARSASVTAGAADVTCVVGPADATQFADGTTPPADSIVVWVTAPCVGDGGSTPGEVAGGSAFAIGGGPAQQRMLVAGTAAKIVNGQAAAPADAPLAVQEAIWQANQIIGLPYIYGGGHQSFTARGYDCSGTVSYALHGGDLLRSPMDSTQFERWGRRGVGSWITIFANAGHAYMDIAGIRLDTSSADDPSGLQGPRWRPLRVGNRGYVVRHPRSL